MIKIFSLLLLPILLADSCKKNGNELSKLPTATQTGANTFGCLINGKAFIPNGYDGNKPNFHVVADPTYMNGDLLIEAYRYIDNYKQKIFLGSDSIKTTGHYEIKNLGRTSVGYDYQNCYIMFIDSVYRTGYLDITKYDISNGILSGTFEAILLMIL